MLKVSNGRNGFEPRKIYLYDLLYAYINYRYNYEIYEGVSEEDLNHLVEKLLNSVGECQQKLSFEVEPFSEVCKKAIKMHISWKKEPLIQLIDGKVFPTYHMHGNVQPDFGGFLKNDIDNAFCALHSFTVLPKNAELKTTFDVSNFNLRSVPCSELNLAKSASAYITIDLAKRYVKKQLEYKYWPSQCSDAFVEIFERDLATQIYLEGTKENFINLYEHSIKTISEMLSRDKSFILSNNNKSLLAFSNFSRIIQPFSFISKEIYNEYEIGNKKITLDFGANFSVSKKWLVESDPYDEWNDVFGSSTVSLDDGNPQYKKLEVIREMKK